MKIVTTAPLVDFAGNAIDSGKLTIGVSLSTILANHESAVNRMKYYTLATSFHNDKEVTIDSADAELIKTAVEATKIYNNLVVGQLLLLFVK